MKNNSCDLAGVDANPLPRMPLTRLTWVRDGQRFDIVAPDHALVVLHADALLAWYNAPDNASMMEGSGAMTRDDVIEFWTTLQDGGGYGFLAFVDGRLVGDADVRGIEGSVGEFAIMIGDSRDKGRGIGKTIARMVHVFAYREIGLERLYVPPRRDNAPVHALNAFLGYERDDSPAARAFADSPHCDTYSMGAETFRRLHADAWAEVRPTSGADLDEGAP